MFTAIYDWLSYIWSWKWPSSEGQITEVVIEKLPHGDFEQKPRLSISYKFSIGEDGPYCGEDFWSPFIEWYEPISEKRRHYRKGDTVLVRYRRDDPSVNRLDKSVWRTPR